MGRLVFVLLLLLCGGVYAQEPAGQPARNNLPIGKAFGILRDSLTKAPLEFASVALLRLSDSIAVGGSLSDEKGHFSIPDIPAGRYRLRVTSIGYRNMDSRPFDITPREPEKDFGIVNMPPALRNLNEVTVTAERADFINALDRKVYNADQSITGAGGTAADILQNIPSVQVDIDGTVSLRGNENVTILIDGKPTSLGGGDLAALLQQLPAGSIEQVEVITNPSSRYEAEGMAGIINIKTKREKNVGVNGTLTGGIGTGDKYNGSALLNRRGPKTNISAQYSFRNERRTFEGNSARYNSYTEPASVYYSDSEGRNYNESHNIRSGLDWFMNDYNTLSLTAAYNQRFERRPDITYYRFEGGTFPIESFYSQNNEHQVSEGGEASLDYRHLFRGTKRELNMNATLSQNLRDETERYETGGSSDTETRLSLNDGKFTVASVQADYIHPFKDTSALEAGFRASLRENDNEVNTLVKDFDLFETDPRFTDHFIYEDQILAAYLQYGSKISVFNYMIGIRAEHSIINGNSESADDFKKEYTDFFPSATIRYIAKKKDEWQLSYSRRINRPRNNSLNPFTDVEDTLNIRRGNPELEPEYVSALEFGYFKRIGDHSLSATVYYRYTDNMISRYRTLDTVTQVSLTTFENFASSEIMGFEFILRNQFGKLINSTTSFNLYRNTIDGGDNINEELKSENINWNVRSTVNVKLAPQTSLQITGNYTAPMKQPQGTFKGFSGVDAGIRHDFTKQKLTLNVNVSDIFDTRHFEMHNTGIGYTMDSKRKRETRILNATLAWRFGKADISSNKKKQNRQQENQQSPDFEGDF